MVHEPPGGKKGDGICRRIWRASRGSWAALLAQAMRVAMRRSQGDASDDGVAS